MGKKKDVFEKFDPPEKETFAILAARIPQYMGAKTRFFEGYFHSDDEMRPVLERLENEGDVSRIQILQVITQHDRMHR